MSKFPFSESRHRRSSSSPHPRFFNHREINGVAKLGDPASTIVTVAHFIEQLHANVSSQHEKELITARLLGISRARKDARMLIGSHTQAIPLFISILRSGTTVAKVNVAATLSCLCAEEELRLKVLLGGCVPPLLSLLKSESLEARKAAAEAIYEVSCGGLSDDHVGMKIFVTEGVISTLWDELNPNTKQDKVVEGFLAGALKNLCGDNNGYWKATLNTGRIDTVIGLLSSDDDAAQTNAASLLVRLITASIDCLPRVIDAGAVEVLLQLVDQENDILVRASAADALAALSSKSTSAKKAMVDANGVSVLIRAVVLPSKEHIQGVACQDLQRHAIHALVNICGGMSALILYLAELSQSPRLAAPVADIIGTLAYSLMVFEQPSDGEDPIDSRKVENILFMLLKPRDSKLVQERVLEAMASLYSNTYLSGWLDHAETKNVLIGLITMASADVQEYLILSLIGYCCNGLDIWEALRKREGIQLLISLLGLFSEQHQEYAVAMLSILTDQVDDSKWAITAAGGIPPLVQLLEKGSQKAREDAAHVLWNLCCHSEDIRACVERAGAATALIWLLQNGGPKGQEASAMALTELIHSADSATINQLMALLLGDSAGSKANIIRVLGHVLTMSPHEDLVQKDTPANMGLRSLVQVLISSNEETQECAASELADLFSARQDICDNFATDEIMNPCMKLLTSQTQVIATQSARALGALSRPKNNPTKKVSYVADGGVKPLIKLCEGNVKLLVKLAKTSSIDTAETAVAALADLLPDPQTAAEALAEDIVSVVTRVLGEGTSEGKKNASCALHQLLVHFPVEEVLVGNAQCRFAVLAVVDSLSTMDLEGSDVTGVLELVALLAMTKQSENITYPPWTALSEVPSSLEPLVCCLAEGLPPSQDRAIEILSRLCGDQPVVLGDLLVAHPKSIVSLVHRIMNSSSLEVRVGGAALLICAVKEHKKRSMAALDSSGFLKPLIYVLVDMMSRNSSCNNLEIEVRTPRGYKERTVFQDGGDFEIPDPATVLGGTVASWLLSIISSFHEKNKITVMRAGAVEALADKLTSHTTNPQAEFEDTEGIWISALLLAILFRDANVVLSPALMRIIPSLSLLLKSDEVIDRYFAAQAMASLVSCTSKEIHLAVATSGALGGLITIIGYIESDMPNLVALSEEFSLVCNPEQVVLEHLIETEDVKVGTTVRKSIPLLVDLLRPMPDRPGAPSTAVRLLACLAGGSDANKLAMADAGALDALNTYLSLSPEDSAEASISELLGNLYGHPNLLHHRESLSSLNQLIAVLRMGSRRARFSATRTLHRLFDAEELRETELARQAIQPLLDMLVAGSEGEQQAALVTLVKLTSRGSSKVSSIADAERNPLEGLYKILSSSSSLEVKKNAAEFCVVLFGNSKMRALPFASECIMPLISLMQSNSGAASESSIFAFERLLDNEKQVELVAAFDIVDLLGSLISVSNHLISQASINSLIKLGKDRTHLKLDMIKAGVVDNCLKLLHDAPGSLCASIAELFRILTNSSKIARSSDAARILEPLFMVLLHPDISMKGQHSALQGIVNILEKPQSSLSTLSLNPSQILEPLISFLGSSTQAIQQLSAELLSHLLAHEHFQQDITTESAIVPLVQLARIGTLNLQQIAIKSLESLSTSWPKAVADAGGFYELSRIITQDDPQPPIALWESAALILSNVLEFNTEYYFRVPLVVLVRMLHSTREATITVALDALIVQESNDALSAEFMAEAGAIDSLLDLLRSHRCEEESGRLLEALFNNARVREMKISKYAIAPLSQYLLDPQTRSQSGRLLAAMTLGDLFQHEGLAKANDSVSACHALVSLLEGQPSEDMIMVATCALQNLVVHSKTNRRAVAEAGGISLIQENLLSQNSEVAAQTALLIKTLFSNATLQEYVSNELIKSLTAALEKELWSTATINVEVLKTINVIFSNFPKLHASEAATLIIPHLVGALKAGDESAKDSALDTLCLLKESWTTISIDIAKPQATIAAEAIPILQLLMKTCPPYFHERANNLLHCLPGCLTVTIKRGVNLKQSMGSTNAFCRLTIGNGPTRQTKVVSHSTSPEWKEGFTWAFDVPPKGQKLHIICKSKNTFGKPTLGRVTIQMEKIVTDGVHSGLFRISHDSNKDASSRMLEIEIIWSSRMSNDESMNG